MICAVHEFNCYVTDLQRSVFLLMLTLNVAITPRSTHAQTDAASRALWLTTRSMIVKIIQTKAS